LIPVSVIVLTRNEEANLAKCLASTGGFPEVFVVDSRSTDGTKEIAEAQGARVVSFDWNGRYPKKKQWEELTPALVSEIKAELAVRTPDTAGYYVSLDYRFLGKVLSHGQRVRKLALFDRRRGRFEVINDLAAKNMWEVEGHYQPRVAGAIGSLKAPLIHDDHDSLFHYFARHNRYSDWEATLRHNTTSNGDLANGTQMRSRKKAVFEVLPFKSVGFFLYSYVIQRGFLDGRAGFHYALAKAFYYWQIRVKEIELADRGR
jgi:glycosyltransferase involved in cell wall biosynthesis